MYRYYTTLTTALMVIQVAVLYKYVYCGMNTFALVVSVLSSVGFFLIINTICYQVLMVFCYSPVKFFEFADSKPYVRFGSDGLETITTSTIGYYGTPSAMRRFIQQTHQVVEDEVVGVGMRHISGWIFMMPYPATHGDIRRLIREMNGDDASKSSYKSGVILRNGTFSTDKKVLLHRR